MAKYYKSKADKAMTQLSEVYGQIVDEQDLLNERTIATYEGGTKREVVQEIAPLVMGAARVAPIIARGVAKLVPKIVKGAKALMPGAKAAAKQVGQAAVAGAAQGVQQRVQNKVAGQPPQQEQEEEFSIGTLVDLELPGGGTGEIIDISTAKPGHYWVETDSDSENILVHADDIIVANDQAVEVDFSRPEDKHGAHTAGRTEL